MKLLFIGDVFQERYEETINQAAKAGVEYSSILFQRRLLSGFAALHTDVTVLSAPAVGAYPKKSRWLWCRHLENSANFRYVSFCNLWGFRNLSQTRALRAAVRRFLRENAEEKIRIYAYSAHSPFTAAACYAKGLRPDIRVCLIVPDLPQYMNLESGRSRLYDWFKAIDNRLIARHTKHMDAFVVLTEQMKEKLSVRDRPCMVQEGVMLDIPPAAEQGHPGDEKRIVYTGKLYNRFGIPMLVDAFRKMDDPRLRLILCGTGDARDYVIRCAHEDSRIDYRGFVPPAEAAALVRSADVLVNPRMDGGEYTKYSFPSKNIEYLLSGHPVVACPLDGMPPAYRDFMYCFSDAEGLKQAIRSALAATGQGEKYRAFLAYAGQRLTASRAASHMIEILGD